MYMEFTIKSNLRRICLNKRSSISKKEIFKHSGLIKRRLFATREYLLSQNIMFYVSFNNEVNTHDMIKIALNNKTVIVPKIIERDILPIRIKKFDELSPATIGILEPITCDIFNKDKIELVIVPCIAFDIYGNRIGYGHGYYDRFLKTVSCTKILIAFESQLIDTVPRLKWDVPVDKIITEKRILTPRRNS